MGHYQCLSVTQTCDSLIFQGMYLYTKKEKILLFRVVVYHKLCIFSVGKPWFLYFWPEFFPCIYSISQVFVEKTIWFLVDLTTKIFPHENQRHTLCED